MILSFVRMIAQGDLRGLRACGLLVLTDLLVFRVDDASEPFCLRSNEVAPSLDYLLQGIDMSCIDPKTGAN